MGKKASKVIEGSGGGSIAGGLLMGPVGTAVGAVGGEGFQGTLQNPLGSLQSASGNVFGGLNDPFGAEKIAREQQAQADQAIEDIASRDITSDSTTTSTSRTKFDPKSKRESELQQASIDAFNKQRELVASQQEGIRGRAELQTGARDTLGGILGGQAFDLTAGEQARIDNLRGADIAASRGAVDEMLNERLAQLNADAASRGVRGQAFSQLQGSALGASARELNMATQQANVRAAEQAISMPGQRVGVQAQTGGQFAGFADALQQQAIQNQGLLQDPIAMQNLRDERLRAGTTTNTQTGTNRRDLDPTSAIEARARLASPSSAKVAANKDAIATAIDISSAAAQGGA